jgi:hypothetical protein
MTTANSMTGSGFYFSLPRVLHQMRGSPAAPSENHAIEAYLGSIGAFLITFLYGWELLIVGWRGGPAIVAGMLLVFAVWMFWILVFYLNSLLIKLLRLVGLFRQTSNRDAQNIFIGVVIAILAYRLSILPTWAHWIGVFCLTLLTINLLAALFLKLLPKPR